MVEPPPISPPVAFEAPGNEQFVILAKFNLHMDVLLDELHAFTVKGDESEEGLPLSLARMNAVLSREGEPKLEPGETREEARQAVNRVLSKVGQYVDMIGNLKSTRFRLKVYEAAHIVHTKLKLLVESEAKSPPPTPETGYPCKWRSLEFGRSLEKIGMPSGVGQYIARAYGKQSAEEKMNQFEIKWNTMKNQDDILRKLRFHPYLIPMLVENHAIPK